MAKNKINRRGGGEGRHNNMHAHVVLCVNKIFYACVFVVISSHMGWAYRPSRFLRKVPFVAMCRMYSTAVRGPGEDNVSKGVVKQVLY